ncbi:hypothetical protein AJ80_03702 [Polytolypa hystricis UAMH7299]|uniref:Uncharacterized protein n=1 Tax=Polytolypa hystricis (strain UAMH7299) TaxID=1447883 RepID=A0A2B7YGN9_POLH7|nr:hypothetical protein AJ80_03702 [Polytolypa hystricis UAMH7299]
MPTITRYVQSYNTVPADSEVIICAEKNVVTGLQQLFSTGKASPHDCDQDDWSPLMTAAFFHTPEAYEFLLQQGANAQVYEINSQDDQGLLSMIWLEWIDGNSKGPGGRNSLEEGIAIRKRMTSLAIEQGCDPNMITLSRCESLLHHFLDEYVQLSSPRQLSGLVNYSIAIGCDLDSPDVFGKTPLLQAAEYCNRRAFNLIARKGADVTVVDDDGNNALHLLLRGCDWPIDDDDHECKGLCDALAESPSECSVSATNWDIWAEALARVGYTPFLVPEIPEFAYRGSSTWFVVSAGYRNGARLTTAATTALKEWKAHRTQLIQ